MAERRRGCEKIYWIRVLESSSCQFTPGDDDWWGCCIVSCQLSVVRCQWLLSLLVVPTKDTFLAGVETLVPLVRRSMIGARRLTESASSVSHPSVVIHQPVIHRPLLSHCHHYDYFFLNNTEVRKEGGEKEASIGTCIVRPSALPLVRINYTVPP